MKKLNYIFLTLLTLIGGGYRLEAQRILSLKECKALAAENSRELQNQRLDIEAAKELKREALSKYFPKIEAVGLYANSAKPFIKLPMVNPATGSPFMMSMLKNGKTAAITAVQPVFAGGQIINANKLAKVNEASSSLQLALKEEDIEKEVEQYFYQILSLKENLKTVEAMTELLKSIRKDVKTAIKAGLRTQGDLLQVQMKEYDLSSTKLKIENGLLTTSLLLKQLIGLLEQDVDFQDVELSDIASPEQFYTDPFEAAARRPEAELLEYNIRAATLKKRSEIGKILPTIGVGAGYLYHDFMGNDFNTALFTINVSIPISDWWGGSRSVKQRKIELEKAENQRDNSLELLRVQIEHSWQSLQEAFSQVKLREKALETSEENLRNFRNGYKAGTISLSDLFDAQSGLQQSRDNLTSALSGYRLCLTEYKLLVGR